MISAPSLLLKNRGPIDSSLLFLHVGSLVGFHRTCTPTLTVGILFDCFPDHALTRVLLDYEAKVGVWTLHRVHLGFELADLLWVAHAVNKNLKQAAIIDEAVLLYDVLQSLIFSELSQLPETFHYH